MIHMYSDGGSQPNGGPSGWGVVIIYPSGQIAQHCGYLGNGSNNQAELQGFINGIKRIDPSSPVTAHLDSKYVLDAIGKGWIKNWLKNGWKTAKGTPVANQNLWLELIEVIKGRNITYEWVKGHSGDAYNDMADKLATTVIAINRDKT